MALSTSVKFSFWALLVTLATRVMAEEIFNLEAGIAVKADETEDSKPGYRGRRAVFTGQRGFSPQDKKDIVNRHNSLRAQRHASNMQNMRWDNNLENLAQEWSNRCVFTHSTQQRRSNVGGFSYVGENLFVTTGKFEPAGIVQSWYDEVKDYHYDSNTCNAGKMCGHYTQVVWADSKAVGCGVTYCGNLGGINWRNGYLITCNYGPGGNWAGQKPYKT